MAGIESAAFAIALTQLGTDAVKTLGPVLVEKLRNKLKPMGAVNHGSKVKWGMFKECTIEMFGDKSFISVEDVEGQIKIVFLNAENIQSCRFIKKKKRINWDKPFRGKEKYYYYDITFQDKSESYVRMRKKYRDAMIAQGVVIT